MRQCTLVALYGAKSVGFAELIARCQTKIATILGDRFSPYDLDQIHATIVGLEALSGSPLRNLNFQRYRKKSLLMDLAGFRKYLLMGGRIPFSVQIGGFLDREYPFTSRGQRPYSRSFSIQGDKAVLVGWPIRGQFVREAPPSMYAALQEARLYPSTLDEIRLSAQTHNILHSYHRSPSDIDNDFYLRIGLIHEQYVDDVTRQRLEQEMCLFLSSEHPLLVEVGLSELFIASYEDDTLPASSTLARPVLDAKLTADGLDCLYE